MFSNKIFSVSFGMGVVSGVVMPFQFGTNWSRFSDATANVLSPLAAIGIVSLWTPFIHEDIARRWFSWPNLLFLSPVPIITALLAWVEWRSLNDDSEIIPFVGGVGLFVSAYIGIAISLWPNIVPYRFSIWEAASSESTQAFLMVGTLFLLPIILMYSGWSYWVFRGKVRSDIGYH
jgi:cytochrome d ubiquinol oxidase subunit II